jgi:hypothetical protein
MAARLGLRRPVRREGAEQYLFLTLVAFAVTVMATRVYLEGDRLSAHRRR